MTWIHIIPRDQATGELAEVYAEMATRPMPAIYQPNHDDQPNIIRVHGLDPELMRRTFTWSRSLATDDTLAWKHRELVNTVTSRLNQCFY